MSAICAGALAFCAIEGGEARLIVVFTTIAEMMGSFCECPGGCDTWDALDMLGCDMSIYCFRWEWSVQPKPNTASQEISDCRVEWLNMGQLQHLPNLIYARRFTQPNPIAPSPRCVPMTGPKWLMVNWTSGNCSVNCASQVSASSG